MFRRLMCLAMLGGLVTTFGVFAGAAASSASTAPSGQVMYGGASFDFTTMSFVGGGGTVEPAYNGTDGSIIYLQTPNGVHVHPNRHNTAPLYIPVYPAGAGIDANTLQCRHWPTDNCPDHGPGIADAAIALDGGVYGAGGGVVGHDHIAGVRPQGDFNVLWEPVLVLFTSKAAVTHLTTIAQVQAAVNSGAAFTFDVPNGQFYCSIVSAASYARGTPAPTVVGP